MARTLLSFVPRFRPAKAHLSINATLRLVQHYHALQELAPDLAAHLEHVAADLHARAESSARLSSPTRAHYVLVWAVCSVPFFI
jgi:hypothetical protein